MNICIITGASSGLGKEYFNIVSKMADIDSVWLIARREDRLNEMADKSGKPCVVLPLDLTDEKSFQLIENKLKAEKPNIKILINNAGFGKLGDVADLEYTYQASMVDLNCRALTAMSAICANFMSKGSYIINVCSIASFAPNPRMTVYSSTKAYAFSFSKSMRFELKKKGINVLAVCAGPMNTEFLEVANISGNSKTFEILPYCNPEKVAKISVKKAQKGRGVYTPKAFFKFYRILAKLLPHGLIMNFSKT